MNFFENDYFEFYSTGFSGAGFHLIIDEKLNYLGKINCFIKKGLLETTSEAVLYDDKKNTLLVSTIMGFSKNKFEISDHKGRIMGHTQRGMRKYKMKDIGDSDFIHSNASDDRIIFDSSKKEIARLEIQSIQFKRFWNLSTQYINTLEIIDTNFDKRFILGYCLSMIHYDYFSSRNTGVDL